MVLTIFLSIQMKPSLTTVRVPVDDMVTRATDLLIEGIENEDRPFKCENFPTEFINRDTCMKIDKQ